MLPDSVIKNICEELEDWPREDAQPGTSSTPTIALRKHLKNRDARALSHVCSSWRLHTIDSLCLWQDIAFDIAEPKSIRLAASLLSLLSRSRSRTERENVKRENVPLHIYAGFGDNDLPDPNLENFLRSLRRHTRRWVVFEYQGSLGDYQSYLDLPAPNLRYFSDHGGTYQNTDQLFAGWAPSLRYLLTSSTGCWDSTPLSNLTEFYFDQSTCGPSPSLNSLLDFFRNAPGLETLRLEWLGCFIHDCAADTSVSLLYLHTLQVHNTDFDTLAEHMVIPNVRRASFTVDSPTHPSLEAPHALTGLSSISILSRPVSKVIIVVARTTDEGTFRIHLTAPAGTSLDMCLIWDTSVMQDWKNYITETLSVLAGRIRLDPGAILHLYLGIGPSRRQSSSGAYKIHGGFARRFFRTLANAETPAMLSPPLTYRLLIANDARALSEDETQMFRLCLQSRTTCEAQLLVRVRHGSSPWLCAVDFECPDECKHILWVSVLLSLIFFLIGDGPHHFIEFEFHPVSL